MIRIHDTRLSIRDIADHVRAYAHWLGVTFDPIDITDDDAGPGGDFRVQVVGHGQYYRVHLGDPSYDTDHSGLWGSGWVPVPCSRRMAEDIARDIIDQIADAARQ